MIGFAVGIGGFGVGVLGILVDRYGIVNVVRDMVFLPLVAGLLATRLKRHTSFAFNP